MTDRTGQVWEDVFGARTSAPIEDYEGPFLVVTTALELKHGIFELHLCVALRSGCQFTLYESPSLRWENDLEMKRIA